MDQLVDTHCHIQSIGSNQGEAGTHKRWATQPDLTAETVINNAKAAGVNRLICVGCDLGDSQLAVDFVKDKTNCWASVGIHPHEAKQYADKTKLKDQLSQLISQPKVVAVGECGLDYYYSHSDKASQISILKLQLELASTHNLPVIFHVREGFDDFWPIFDQYPKLTGVLHSYTDNMANLEAGLKRGLYFGVNGIATFTKDQAQTEVYKAIPLKNLVLETDSPFLTPDPYRGNINEPMRVGTITDYLAKLRGESRSSLANITTDNALNLFKRI